MRRAVAAALCCGFIAALATGAGAEVGSTPDQGTWVTDGPVYAIARAGDRTFVGGDFSYVGRRTGPGVQLAPVGAASPGVPSPSYGSFPEVAGGRVLAAVEDRAGGWYIGGDFTSVGGESRAGIAHLTPDGSGALVLDPDFLPQPAGTVHALALGVASTDSDVLYIGGSFDSFNGNLQLRNFAAVRAGTGEPVGSWQAPDGTVTGLDVLRPGSTGRDYPIVFVAGNFSRIGATAKNRLGAVWGAGAADEGGVLPTFGGTAVAGVRAVRAGVATRNAGNDAIGVPVYLGGNFGLASFRFTYTDAKVAGGGAYGTSPTFACDATLEPRCAASVGALEVSPDGATLYVGGRFDSVTAAAPIGTQPRHNAAAIRGIPDVHSSTAAALVLRSWAPDPDSAVGGLALLGSDVYLGGDFAKVLGEPRLGMAAVGPSGVTAHTVPSDAALRPGWDPRLAGGIGGATAGTVNVVSTSSNGVYVGGSFTAVEAEPHANIAALDAGGALVPDWVPSANAPVFALAAGNDRLYLGGLFTDVSGQSRRRLAAVSPSSGEVDGSFAPAVEPACEGVGCDAPVPGVLSLATSDQRVYVGGSFASLAGAQRANAGAVNATDGTALGWAPNPDSTVYSLLATCGTVYAGGAFSTAGGQARSRIAALDPQTGVASDWNPSANGGAVYALARDSNVVYAGGSFATIGGTERKRLAGIDATTGEATPFSPSVSGTSDFVRALAVPPGGGVVYAGGQITRVFGSRSYAAAFNTTTGDLTAWDSGADDFVRALAPAGDALLIGGEFRQLGSRMQQGFGSFGLATAGAGAALVCEPPPEPVPEPEPIPEPEPPAPRPVAPYRDTAAPILGQVTLTNKRFRTAEPRRRTASASARKRAPVGTRVKYRLSEPSVLRLVFSRRIRVPCKTRKAKKPCYRWRRAGSMGHLSRAGAAAPRFRGKVGRRWLRPGRYRVRVRAVDPAGNRSAAQRRAFTIVQR